jgi:hypothetical protein
MNKWGGCLLLCLCLLLPSCRTAKDSVLSLSDLDKEGIFNAMVDNSLQYITLSGKLNVEIVMPRETIKSKAHLKIVKNQAIQLSIQPVLGFEMFRMLLSKDSILIIDRMNQEYILESMRDANGFERLDFNFYGLQSLLSNNIFLNGKPIVLPSDYQKFSIEEKMGMAFVQTMENQKIQYLLSGEYHGKIRSTYIFKPGHQLSLLSEYANFKEIPGAQLFPMKMRIVLKGAVANALELRFSYSNIELNNDFELNFEIPSKYKKILLSDALMNVFKK